MSSRSDTSSNSTVSDITTSDLQAIKRLLEKRHMSSAPAHESSCMNWLIPLLVAIGVGLLVYMLYNYSNCHQKGHGNMDNNDNENGIIVVSNMANNNKNNGQVIDNSKNNGQVIDKDGNQILQLSNEKPIIVAFVAQGCGWCTKLKEPLTNAAKKVSVQIYTMHAHSTGGMDMCKKYGVKGFPTILQINKGSVVSEYQGNRSDDDIVRWIKSIQK